MARAKTRDKITVRVTRSFEGLVMGETFETPLTDRVQGLINGALLEVVGGGESAPGPGAVDAGDSGGSSPDAAPEGPSGAEPGEDPGAG
jgi:hypothetical protein